MVKRTNPSIIKQQYGISLVEVLASIVIVTIVSSLVYSIVIKSNDHYNNQYDKNMELSDISYKLKLLTKEIRKASDVNYLSPNSMDLVIESATTNFYYDSSAKTLYKDSSVYIHNVEKFVLTPNSTHPNKVAIINIEIINDKLKDSIQTKIIVRSGD
ncbi:prepilin-type N-terminal cleavage/methylation domain-containing protein [Lysinibacillus sp. BW-2-10]|uniref:prepilin-type N-terminal cleavage/methylation domain-containing protein n=1 Tax=Lysinibacillus sp. BW-2-10 TaxID=2590030 RepID=UPI00117C4295|nr:prepilin-type N-terminal cleavage/methylation domain-containing protein [Lysinibacillus sp. BW-2-10]TSI10137.1 hypothetical protein FJQ64_04515 [Lysinibacillus sp. BW-2-10]